MTNSPNPDQEPEPRSTSRRRRPWLRLGLAAGGLLLGGAVAGGWWLWQFVHDDLPPLVSRSLSDTISRPVEVGPLEGISLTSLRFGRSAVPATATDPDRATVEAIEVKFNPLQLLWDRTLLLDVTLVRPDIYLEQDRELQWVEFAVKEGGEPGPVQIKLDRLRLQDANLVLAAYGGQRNGRSLRSAITFPDVDGSASFREDNKLISFDVTGQPQTGGRFQVEGQSDLRIQETKLSVQARDLLATDISLLLVPYTVPVTVQNGRLTTDLRAQFRPGQTSQLFGTARFANLSARIENVPRPIANASGGLRFQGTQIALQDVQGQYGKARARVAGSLDLQRGYSLTARLLPIRIADVLETAGTTSPIPVTGGVRAEARVTGPIDRPAIAGFVASTSPLRVDRLNLSQARTRFSFTGDTLRLNAIQATLAAGGTLTGQGQVKLGGAGGLVVDVTAQGLAGDAIAQAYGASLADVRIGSIDATAQVLGTFENIQTLVQWQAPQASYPGRGKILIAGNDIRFQDTVLLVAGGLVRGRGRLDLEQDRWQAFLDASGVELRQFSSQLRGLFSGTFELAGGLSNFSLASVQAQGEARFSEGVSYLRGPLTASVRWLGDRLQIRQAEAPGFSASGVVLAELAGTPGVRSVDLNVQLRNYDLATLPVALPPQVRVAGLADFDGRVTGPLAAINVAGRVGLDEFAVNSFAFEPLRGDVRYRLNQGLDLDLAGRQDRIAVQLDARNRPRSFYVQQGTTIAEGRGNGDRLMASVQNLPLQAFNIAPAAQLGLGQVGGLLNGEFDLNLANLNNPRVMGRVAIANPSLDYISADSLTASFRYMDGVAVLDQGELRRGGSVYLLAGSFDPNTDPFFQGQVTAAPGRVEDILAAAQWFELSDIGRVAPPSYAGAAAVQTTPVGLPNASLLNQLRRFSEVVALRNQQIAAREQASFLPDLSEFRGQFSGDVQVAVSRQTGPSATFNLSGEDWTWGDYQVNQVLVQGGFENGVVTLLPLRVQADQSFLSFTGQVGGEQQSGQLRAENIPVAALRDLFKLPVDIEGNLDANATLSGSVGNPQVLGEITLADGTVNGTQVPAIRSLFGYNNARLNADARVVEAIDSDTFQVEASIPYSLPFMTVTPESNALSVDAEIRNNGLALLNLFTDQVAWKGGEAEVIVQTRGTVVPGANPPFSLTTIGNATFNDGIVRAKVLPEDLTNISGRVLFNTDRIQVETLQGQFQNGQVTAQGVLPLLVPLSESDRDAANPLTVALDNVRLDFKNPASGQDLYDGGIDGQVLITGAAFTPVIGGDILLSDGRVTIPSGETTSTTPATPASSTASSTAASGGGNPIRLNNLVLTLGDRVRVTSDPLLDFVARGDLTINGTFDDLRPDGTIRLLRGQVNLFTTRFNLDRSSENTAVFTPSRGLDPVLNVSLVTSVPEVTRVPAPDTSPFASAEIADTPTFNYGAFQTVRIQARASGPASQLSNNLELTSTPARTESEIVALIGGSFVNTLGQGGATTAIATLAGSTVLGQLQSLINDATGLTTSFSLFPISIPSENATSSSALALAAEFGVDLTEDLTVSIIPILTSDQPTLYGFTYRINDQLSVRSSTDFSGENRASIEFQTRF